jgi:hypothetical protein
MRCKHIMLGATMFAAAALAAPAFAAPAGTQTGPASTQAEPNNAMGAPGAAQPGNSAMHSSSSQANAKPIPLTSVSDSKTKIMAAPVQDSAGNTVGTVQQVSTNPSGKAKSVDVTLTTAGGQSKVVKIKASKLRYDSASNLLKADLTKSEIENLPKATTTTNP